MMSSYVKDALLKRLEVTLAALFSKEHQQKRNITCASLTYPTRQTHTQAQLTSINMYVFHNVERTAAEESLNVEFDLLTSLWQPSQLDLLFLSVDGASYFTEKGLITH